MIGRRRRSREEANAHCFSDVPGTSNSVPENSQFEPGPDLKSDIENILSALQQVRQKTISDGQKKSDELLSSTAAEIKALVDQAKEKIHADREALSKQSTKICKEYETALKEEAAKYKTAYATFSEAKDAHLRAYEGKKEKAAYTDLEGVCSQKLSEAEQAIKKLKMDEKSFHNLKRSLGTIFEDSSDEEVEIIG
ncbi:hypothetical protein R1sor_020359 [Riccia sorocarpa]|uniref:Uncharacterized protein n=1 Tax=Riccia sorocarpa TaxID=122646 RepID=A0ABD3IHY8_9MARC